MICSCVWHFSLASHSSLAPPARVASPPTVSGLEESGGANIEQSFRTFSTRHLPFCLTTLTRLSGETRSAVGFRGLLITWIGPKQSHSCDPTSSTRQENTPGC